MPTTISWAEETWNPVTGCDRVSRGCDNCYALTLAGRLKAMEAKRISLGTLRPEDAKYQTDGDPRTSGPGFGVALHPHALAEPLQRKTPTRWFVPSMSDLFHPKVPDGFIARVWDVMGRCPQHQFLIPTKRTPRMRSWVNRWADRTGDAEVADKHGFPPGPRGPEAVRDTYTSGRATLFAAMLDSMGTPPEGAAYPTYDWMEGQRWWPDVLPNVWLGTSVEDQETAETRMQDLLNTLAIVHWVSVEPLLGPVDFTPWLDPALLCRESCQGRPTGQQPSCSVACRQLAGTMATPDWFVVGGESGLHPRPMSLDWARQIRDDVLAAGVPFHFKQLGTVAAKQLGLTGKGDRWEDLPAEFQIREYPRLVTWS